MNKIRYGRSLGASPDGGRATRPKDQAPAGLGDTASVPSALNVAEGLYLDTTGHAYPVTNWFDAEGDECPREDAVVCVAGEGGCWFALTISDFTEAGGRA
jgi:hypothetical protein